MCLLYRAASGLRVYRGGGFALLQLEADRVYKKFSQRRHTATPLDCRATQGSLKLFHSLSDPPRDIP